MLRSHNYTNTYHFSGKVGLNVELTDVDDEKKRRDCVSNKEIASAEIEKRCTRGVNLWNKPNREGKFLREGTKSTASNLEDVIFFSFRLYIGSFYVLSKSC